MLRLTPLVSLALLAACTTEGRPAPDPPENPITVELVNTGGDSLFIGANLRPFSIVDDRGTRWRSGPSAIELDCDQCQASCGRSPDLAPSYIEIPAGGSYPASWDGRLRAVVKGQCSCPQQDLDCLVPRNTPYITLTFDVAYTDQPPRGDTQSPIEYDKTPAAGGAVLWVEKDATGLEELDRSQSIAVSYSGQATIRLEL